MFVQRPMLTLFDFLDAIQSSSNELLIENLVWLFRTPCICVGGFVVVVLIFFPSATIVVSPGSCTPFPQLELYFPPPPPNDLTLLWSYLHIA